MNLDKTLAAFTFSTLQSCSTLMQHLSANRISDEEFFAHIFKEAERVAQASTANAIEAAAIRERLFKASPKCPACKKSLGLVEATEDAFESVLSCQCGYKYYTDVSVADWKDRIEADAAGKPVEFETEDIRASAEERSRRREICKKCVNLMANNKCRVCGCRMKHRTYYDILKCPKKFW